MRKSNIVKTRREEWNKPEVEGFLGEWKLPDDWVFSPSQFSTYNECPRGWFLKYACRIAEEHTWLNTLVGSAFHARMEDYYGRPEYYKRLMSMDAKKLKVMFVEDIWDRVSDAEASGLTIRWPEPKTEDAKEMATGAWQMYLVQAAAGHMINWMGMVPKLNNPKTEQELYIKVPNANFVGYADVIGYDDMGRKVVLDYKTKGSAFFTKVNDFVDQVMAYCSAVDFVDLAVIPICYRLDQDPDLSIYTFLPDRGAINRTINKYADFVKAVQHGEFPCKKKRVKFCDNVCAFASLCWGEDATLDNVALKPAEVEEAVKRIEEKKDVTTTEEKKPEAILEVKQEESTGRVVLCKKCKSDETEDTGLMSMWECKKCGEEFFMCPHCEKGGPYVDNKGLKRHIREKHPDVKESDEINNTGGNGAQDAETPHTVADSTPEKEMPPEGTKDADKWGWESKGKSLWGL